MEINSNRYEVPKRDGSVWPEDICPAYTADELFDMAEEIITAR